MHCPKTHFLSYCCIIANTSIGAAILFLCHPYIGRGVGAFTRVARLIVKLINIHELVVSLYVCEFDANGLLWL